MQPVSVLPRAEERPVLSVEEMGAILGIGRSTAYRYIAEGTLPSLKIGTRVLVPTAKLRRVLGFDG